MQESAGGTDSCIFVFPVFAKLLTDSKIYGTIIKR